MTAQAAGQTTDRRRAVRNVGLLAALTAIPGAQMPVYITLGGLAGAQLSDDPGLATLPIACQMVAAMIFALPISMLMGRFGRQLGFSLGLLGGIFAAGVGALAIYLGEFWLLCVAHTGAGLYQTAQGYFRFAAADTADEAFRPRAISLVLAGGLFAAIIGAELLVRTQDLLAPVPFAGAYAALIGVNLLGLLLIPLLDIPKPTQQGRKDGGRPWPVLLRNPAIPTAMLCAMLIYGTMTLVMTASPLAVVGCGFESADAANIVKWHVLAMFAPSFFTGAIVARFGAPMVIAAGLVLLTLCAAAALYGVELEHFYTSMILLGLGWNLGFIGATSMLSANHRPEERPKVQGMNDFLVMATVAAAALGSGKLFALGGWETVAGFIALPVALAAVALAWGSLSRRTSEA